MARSKSQVGGSYLPVFSFWMIVGGASIILLLLRKKRKNRSFQSWIASNRLQFNTHHVGSKSEQSNKITMNTKLKEWTEQIIKMDRMKKDNNHIDDNEQDSKDQTMFKNTQESVQAALKVAQFAKSILVK